MQSLHKIATHLNVNIMTDGLPKTDEELTKDILSAINQIKDDQLKLHNQKVKAEKEEEAAEEARRIEERVRQDTENMNPWERQKYYDSWSGGMS